MAAVSQSSRPSLSGQPFEPNERPFRTTTSDSKSRLPVASAARTTATDKSATLDSPGSAGAAATGRPQRLSNHISTPSIGRGSRSGSILSRAAAAIDKTHKNLSAPSELKVRPRKSLSRLPSRPDSVGGSDSTGSEKGSSSRSPSIYASLPPTPQSTVREGKNSGLSNGQHPQHYGDADAAYLPHERGSRPDNKMHQTSSRLLRMTDDDRPFTKDFKDLFGTLIVSLLPLSAHRVRLTKVEHTFLSEDAINNLGSLKFSQSNRMPDPKDPSRIVTTTTTTTFSMAKDMARQICQRFLEARFIESADGKYQQNYSLKGSVWQLTPKGISVLDRFCARNGIQQRQVGELVGPTPVQLVSLERDAQTDKLITDRGTMEVIFRRFIGVSGLNVKSTVAAADSDSLSDYRDGLTGVKMAHERRIGGKTYRDTFTGKAVSDWLMDCSTTVDRRETFEIAALFVEYDLMEAVHSDRNYTAQFPTANLFQPTKSAVYQMTNRGKDLINGGLARGRSSESEGGATARAGIARDSNTQRLDKILNDPALRLLFRENLRETHCEENLSFYVDVEEFIRSCRQAIRAAQKTPGSSGSMDGIKEIMAQAYGIYNAFLAPGSPCELNIDHQLRNNLATRMTKAVGQDVAMIDTLHEVTALFEDAQNAVFKLMASDSVPKFLRSPKYEQTLKNYDFDSATVSSSQTSPRAPERSRSRSTRA